MEEKKNLTEIKNYNKTCQSLIEESIKKKKKKKKKKKNF